MDRTALITKAGEEISYSGLLSLADGLVGGIPARSLAIALVGNDAASIAFYVGCMRKGIVALLLGARTDRAAVEELIGWYRPAYLFTGGDEGHTLTKLANSSPGLNDDLALLLSTSGSLGSPKLVRISHKNLASNARSIVSYLGIGEDERAITSLPLSYSYGLSVVNTHLLAHATLILTDEPVIGRPFWDRFRGFGATSMAGVPYTYTMLSRIRFGDMGLPSLRYLTQAGGHLDASLQERFARICEDKGARFFVMYGQTEATARMSYLPPELAGQKMGSIGRAIPGGSLSLVDDDGRVIDAPHAEGELVYAGPNVSLGYAGCAEDLALGDVNRGVLRTGDMAFRDEDGLYYITGRKARFLKVFGNRVGLDELERALAGRGVTCAARGTDDRVELFVEGGAPDEARGLASSLTGIHPSAFRAYPVDALPKTPTGKIDYARLSNR